jgi:hypothetical protein
MTTWQKILAIILALQVVLAGIIFWAQRPVKAESGPLLSGYEAGKVASFKIDNNEGNSVALAKKDGDWVLSSGGDYPADQEAVSTLLDKLAAIQADRLVTRTKDSHKRLQVADDDFIRRLQIELDDGATFELLLGTSPNPRSTNVRLAGQNDVFLTGELLSYDVDAVVSRWIDTTYVNLNKDQVTAMTLENANGTFELRKTDDQWTLLGLEEGEAFDVTGVNTLLGQLQSTHMSVPLGTEEQPAYGLASPLASLAVTVTDDAGTQQTYTLVFGALNPDSDTYVMKWSGSDYYVTAARFTGERFINVNRDTFIAAPPTPTPEATPEG